jgi:hypothetical protein
MVLTRQIKYFIRVNYGFGFGSAQKRHTKSNSRAADFRRFICRHHASTRRSCAMFEDNDLCVVPGQACIVGRIDHRPSGGTGQQLVPRLGRQPAQAIAKGGVDIDRCFAVRHFDCNQSRRSGRSVRKIGRAVARKWPRPAGTQNRCTGTVSA